MKSMGHYIKYIGKLCLTYLSCLSIRDRHVFVFGAWFGNKYSDNPKAFYEYVKKNHPEIRCVWITGDNQVLDYLKNRGDEAYLRKSYKGVLNILRAKYAFVCTGREDVSDLFTGNAVIVNFWHGAPLKKIMYDDYITGNTHTFKGRLKYLFYYLPHRKEYVISTSDTISKIYCHAFRKDEKHVVRIGQPRNDIFYDKPWRGSLRDRFPGKRVITYMPTHRREGRVQIDCEGILDIKALDSFCAANNSIFIIKKHYYHRNEPPISGHGNVVELTQEDLDPQELMLSMDLLISDYSSAYIDYLLLDRPMIFYHYDVEDYLKNDREMYFNYEDVTPGYLAKTFSQLLNELDTIISQRSDTFQKRRQEVAAIFYDEKARLPVCPVVFDMVQAGRFQ